MHEICAVPTLETGMGFGSSASPSKSIRRLFEIYPIVWLMKLEHWRNLKVLLPRSLRPIAKRGLRLLPSQFKYQEEIKYWQNQWQDGKFHNENYRGTMLAMAGQSDDEFLKGKIVADFGCGPQGSLEWASSARARIGIDVLCDAYSQFGIRSQDMVYVTSTEKNIPLPSNYVDVMFTMNAMDHVSNLRRMCDEIRRVIAPGGMFVGSFNLWEPSTFSEPQTLTEEKLNELFLRHLNVTFHRIAPPGPEGDIYRPFFEETYIDKPVPGAHLWVRAVKPI